jgi:hypothetical protein
LQEVCQVLNEFALPRAIFDFERHSFLAWNQRFLQRAGYSEEEIKSSKPEELLTFGESWFPLSEEEAHTVEFTYCAAKRPFRDEPASGYVVRSGAKLGYVMLEIFESPPAQFDQGRVAGREEERNRIIKAFHDEVSSSMIEALFLMEEAKSELEEAGLPQAEAVSKASDILAETTKKIADVITDADGHSR